MDIAEGNVVIPAIVAEKPANEGAPAAEEQGERRKGTAGEQSTLRAQERACVKQALYRVWQAANVSPSNTREPAPAKAGVGAVCGKAARTVLCEGRSVMGVPSALMISPRLCPPRMRQLPRRRRLRCFLVVNRSSRAARPSAKREPRRALDASLPPP